jgi:hypothetical protein
MRIHEQFLDLSIYGLLVEDMQIQKVKKKYLAVEALSKILSSYRTHG